MYWPTVFDNQYVEHAHIAHLKVISISFISLRRTHLNILQSVSHVVHPHVIANNRLL